MYKYLLILQILQTLKGMKYIKSQVPTIVISSDNGNQF